MCTNVFFLSVLKVLAIRDKAETCMEMRKEGMNDDELGPLLPKEN